MEPNSEYTSIFDEEYIEPKQEEKDKLIDKLQSGDFTLSYSSLSAFSVSPRNFIAYKLQEQKTTAAMVMGEAVHCKVLEPDEFSRRYYVAPTVDASTVAGKKVWADIYERFTGEELPINKQGNPVVPKMADMIEAIKRATKMVDENGKTLFHGVTVLPGKSNEEADFRARMLVKNGACRHIIDQMTQTESRVEFEFCGINFTGRVDGYGPNLIADIKNMPDAQLRPANFTIMARKMYWQGFCYRLGMPDAERDCYILAVDGKGETSAHCFARRHFEKAEVEMREYCQQFLETIEESFFNRDVWDMSQDFWLRNDKNPHGINYL